MAKTYTGFTCSFEVGNDFEKRQNFWDMTIPPNTIICKGRADDILKVIADLEMSGYHYIHDGHHPYISSITRWMVTYTDRGRGDRTYDVRPISAW